jgi:hypothetical protein
VAALEFHGDLDETALERAFADLLARHDALRVRFDTVGDRVVQTLCEVSGSCLRLVDLRAQDPGRREANALELARQEAATGIDVTRPPLLRATLIRISEQRHVLVLILHHLICDGRSGSVLMRDLGELYASHCRGVSPSLPPLSTSYLDAIDDHHRRRVAPSTMRSLEYWKRQLAAASVTMPLPLDFPRPERPSLRGSSIALSFAGETAAQLDEFCVRQGCTPFMAFMAGLYTVLYTQTGQSDLLVTAGTANRLRRSEHDLIGYFANDIALRVRVDPSQSGTSLLKQVRRVILEALAHQSVPFEHVLEGAGLTPPSASVPVPQVTFQMHANLLGGIAFPGLTLSPFGDSRMGGFGIHNGTIGSDLCFSMMMEEGNFVGGVRYDMALFTPERIQRLLKSYANLIRGLMSNPERPLANLIEAAG